MPITACLSPCDEDPEENENGSSTGSETGENGGSENGETGGGENPTPTPTPSTGGEPTDGD